MSASWKSESSPLPDLRMFVGMTEKSLRVLYSIGLGIIIALFVGLGIATFYPAPELDYASLSNLEESTRDSVRASHRAAMDDYNRNVTVAALISALIILAASIWSGAKATVFAGGFLIGGMLTLLYGLMRGLTSGVPAVAFFSVAVGLVVVIFLGHQKFFSARAVEARAKARKEEADAMQSRMATHTQYATQQAMPYPAAAYPPYPQPGHQPQPGQPQGPYPPGAYPPAPGNPEQH